MEIQGNGNQISIEKLGISNANASYVWDSKWIKVAIKIKLNGFYADFKSEFILEDLLQFLKSIEDVLSEKKDYVEFKTLEDSFYLKGLKNFLGNIEWSGYAIYPLGDGNKLIFKFESDYYQLEHLKNALAQII